MSLDLSQASCTCSNVLKRTLFERLHVTLPSYSYLSRDSLIYRLFTLASQESTRVGTGLEDGLGLLEFQRTTEENAAFSPEPATTNPADTGVPPVPVTIVKKRYSTQDFRD